MPCCCCCFHGCCQVCGCLTDNCDFDEENLAECLRNCKIKNIVCAFCICFSTNILGSSSRENRFLQSIFIIVMACVGYVLGLLALTNFTFLVSPVKEIVNNWNSGYIIDIQLRSFCKADYQAIAIYEIPSTNDGCFCPESELGDQWIEQGVCADGESVIGCQTIQGKDPIKLKFWSQPTIDEEFITIKVCGRKSKQTFLDQLKKGIFDSKDCLANNLKVCDSNNPNNIVCVQQDEQCPITDLKISLSELSPFEQSIGTYSEIYNDKFYAYVSKTLDNTPLTQAIIVKGSGVCVFRNELSLNPKLTEDYKLNSITPSGCILDERYKSIASTYEDKLFQSNDILEDIKDMRILYQVNKEIQYQLMISNQIIYKPSCRSNFGSFQNISEDFDNAKNHLLAAVVLSFFLLFVIGFMAYKQLRGELKGGDNWCILLFQLIFQYSFSIPLFIGYDKINRLQENLQSQVDQNCFDQLTQNQLQLALDLNQGTVLYFIYILFIIVIVFNSIDLLFIIYFLYDRYDQNQEKKRMQTIQQEQELTEQRNQPNQSGRIPYVNQTEYEFQYKQQQQVEDQNRILDLDRQKLIGI